MEKNKIAEINDQVRKSIVNLAEMKRLKAEGVKFEVSISQSLYEEGKIIKLLSAVAAFSRFDESNDPYGEHDFGMFDFEGKKILFKIDYYDPNNGYGSDDPSDLNKTLRVLNIIPASDY